MACHLSATSRINAGIMFIGPLQRNVSHIFIKTKAFWERNPPPRIVWGASSLKQSRPVNFTNYSLWHNRPKLNIYRIYLCSLPHNHDPSKEKKSDPEHTKMFRIASYVASVVLQTDTPSGHTPVPKTFSRHAFKTSKTLTQKTSIRPKIRRIED